MKFALKLLTAKMQATAGTDPVPTAALNVLNAENVDINPIEMETDTIETVSATFGTDGQIVGAMWCSLSFDIPLSGGGTPKGTPPNHGPILRASGYAQTINGTTDVTYSLVSTGEEMVAIYYYVDGVLWKFTDIRGSWSEAWTAKKAPRASFKGIGLNAPMSDLVMPTPTLPTVPRPIAVNKANTTLTIGGYAARLSSFTLDLNNDVQYLNRTGREEVAIVGRQPSGKVVMELPKLAENDFLGASGICTLGTPQAMSIVHGATAGNVLTRTLPKVQLMKPKPRNEQGILMLECDLIIARSTGNDEMTLVYT